MLRAIPRTSLARLALDRYPTRRRRGQNRNAFYQDILRMVVCEYEYLAVRVLFSLIVLVCQTLRFGTFLDSPRERWARQCLGLAFATHAWSSCSLT